MTDDGERSSAEWGALAGAALTAVAAFLPWYRYEMDASPAIRANGTATGVPGFGILTLALAALVVWLTVGSDERRSLATAATGGAIALVGLWKSQGLVLDTPFVTAVGDPLIGLYVTVLGGLLIAVSGIWASTRDHDAGGTATG